jgi:hypothetical protein
MRKIYIRGLVYMSELKNLIKDSLNGEMLANAMDFTAFLEKNDMYFKESAVSFQDEVVCYSEINEKRSRQSGTRKRRTCVFGRFCRDRRDRFRIISLYMHIDSGEEEPSPWTIWTEGNYSSEIEGVPIDEHTKEIAWEHVNICASCGDCSPGQRKVIFGKEFDNVCNADMAFYRPDVEMLECIKKLLQMRKSSIAIG